MSISKLPDFEGLALLAKVAEERSFAGAARSLNLSVATVSRAIARLELRLGAQVFNRSSRKMTLTDFGRRLAERAALVLAEAEQAESAARELSSRPRGTVNLAVPMSFGLRELSPILPQFIRRYPEITLNLHLSDATTDLIGDGYDAALRIAALPDSSLIARRLRPVNRYLVASPGYVKRNGRPQSPSELNAHHCLGYTYRARTGTWHFTHADGQVASVTPVGPLAVNNIDALVPALLDGLGIAELPSFVADPYVADRRLEILLPEWRLPGGGLYFVTPSARVRPVRIEVLGDFLAEHLSASRSPRD
ncbi:LysR family transcriptional regulator [Rhodopseudomonas telluris]|uniref:LysR family transcriptional regulator n=1 Tax=Rhodopseudomonas telluris TaxID=644215 RepID=A0ABV6ESM4_9BRAD